MQADERGRDGGGADCLGLAKAAFNVPIADSSHSMCHTQPEIYMDVCSGMVFHDDMQSGLFIW